jgi:hypothetical protein
LIDLARVFEIYVLLLSTSQFRNFLQILTHSFIRAHIGHRLLLRNDRGRRALSVTAHDARESDRCARMRRGRRLVNINNIGTKGIRPFENLLARNTEYHGKPDKCSAIIIRISSSPMLPCFASYASSSFGLRAFAKSGGECSPPFLRKS